jgi:hypothetical protein
MLQWRAGKAPLQPVFSAASTVAGRKKMIVRGPPCAVRNGSKRKTD